MSSKKPSADDPALAPESGTDRDETSGNDAAAPQNRPTTLGEHQGGHSNTDDPATAGEER